VATAGRASLSRMLASIAPQLAARDHLTVISDKGHAEAAEAVAAVPCACAKRHIANAAPLGGWGHGSRSAWQDQLPGDFHMNADDDDLYLPHAMAVVRRWVRLELNNTMYVFRMVRRWDGVVNLIPPMAVTRPSQIRPGTVSTQCGVYRAAPALMREWAYLYGGDGVFFQTLVDAFGEENTTVVPALIYHLGQSEDLFAEGEALLAGGDDGTPAVPDVTPEEDARLAEKLRAPPAAEGEPKWMREARRGT